jgi:glycosyltransferase involved in cell wall biosynthesis
MIGVIIPAHNEQQHLGACIDSVLRSALHIGLQSEEVVVLVVLDACTDASALVAQRHGAMIMPVDYRNVGRARSAGARVMLDAGARWLAFTDADTLVSPNWLERQVSFKADAVCGTVRVDSWADHSPVAQARYDAHYQHTEGHRHVHGANLGVCAIAYNKVGGFKPLPAHEDVHLVKDLQGVGANIVWTATTSVITSARRDFRCREGFGEYLQSLA